MNSIKDGKVKMINMEKYETMDFFAVTYLYTFHNDIIRNLNMDHWLQNPLPAIGDSGLVIVTKDNVDTILTATDPNSSKTTPAGLTVPMGDPSRADQEYVWISNASNLPLFVERVYPGLESARKALNVKVRIAGPTSVDLAAFITTVDAECTKNPAGVIVVGGWDDALAAEVDKCIDKKVPTVVTDGDLASSKRLTYLGTNWYRLGYVHGQYQCQYHKDAGLTAGKIGTISFLAASNFRSARQGLRDALKAECPGVQVVADEESGTNVEQVAANTAAILQGNPDLTGMVGFDSEAGPGIVRAIDESGRAGKIIVTSNEAGREFMNSIKDGKVKMINMEKYETMDFFAVLYLYTFHNDIIRNLGMDQWLQNPLPAIGDSGLIFVTSDNVDTILEATKGSQ
jgi:ABC-type sugar transport system substrate-binding protein